MFRLVPPVLLAVAAWKLRPWEVGLPPRRTVPAAAAVAVINLVAVLPLKAARWRHAFRERPTLLAAWAALLEGLLAKIALGSAAGELMRATRLGRDRGMSEAVGATVAERICEGLALALLALAAALWSGRAAPAVAAGLLVALYVALRALGPALRPRLARWPRVVRAIDAGLAGVRPGRALALVAFSLSSWAVEMVMLHLLLAASGLPSDFVTVVVALVAINLAVIVPLSPANLGTLEAGLVAALVARGADTARALGFALLYHLLLVVPVAVVAAIVYASRGSLPHTANRSAS